MIADFIFVKKKLYQFLNLLMATEMKRQAPLMALSRRHVMHEGDASTYETVRHESREMEMKESGSGFSLTREEMSVITFPEIVEKMRSCAGEMARQIEQHAFRVVDEAVAATGNTVVAHGFKPEHILETLEKIQIDFDDTRDKPSMPTIFLHPDMLKKFVEADKAMTTEERQAYEARQEAILDRKYEEYVARESKRRLVD